jgi:hypothetical protein
LIWIKPSCPAETQLARQGSGAQRLNRAVLASEGEHDELSDNRRKLPTGANTTQLRSKWGWILALGVVYVIAGFIALGSVMMATVTSMPVVGVTMIVAGVAEIINAFQLKGWGKFLI